MGLFDKLKTAVKNAASDMKAVYEEASAMDLETLCNVMMDMKKLDPKILVYKTALREKCSAMNDADLEAFYAWIKKQGGIFKTHPGQEVVEDVLVDHDLYSRDEDGTISKNHRLF